MYSGTLFASKCTFSNGMSNEHERKVNRLFVFRSSIVFAPTSSSALLSRKQKFSVNRQDFLNRLMQLVLFTIS